MNDVPPLPDHPQASHRAPKDNPIVATDRPRRRIVAAWLGASCVGLGAGVWWRQQSSATEDASIATLQAALDTAALTNLNGTPLQLAVFAGRPLLINFWATWCPPCVEEMPLLDAFYKDNKGTGTQVLAIAADKPVAVQRFMAQHQLQLPVALGGMGVIDLVRQLGNVSGSLPFSILLNRQRQVVQRKMGKLTPDDLLKWRLK